MTIKIGLNVWVFSSSCGRYQLSVNDTIQFNLNRIQKLLVYNDNNTSAGPNKKWLNLISSLFEKKKFFFSKKKKKINE